MANDAAEVIENARQAVVDALLDKVSEERYPSSTVMDKIEELITPEEIPAYTAVLLNKIRNDQFPSMSMINRLVRIAD